MLEVAREGFGRLVIVLADGDEGAEFKGFAGEKQMVLWSASGRY